MRGVIFLLITIPLFSQDIGSLLKSIETASEKDRIHLWKMVAEQREGLGDLTSAINAYKQSNVWARKGNNLAAISANYLEIAELYFRLGDKDEALIYLRLFSFVNDLIAKKDVVDLSNRLNNLHLLETKALEEQLLNIENRNSVLEKENNRATKISLWTQVFLGLLLIALVIVSYLYYKGINIFSEKSGPIKPSEQITQAKIKEAQEESSANSFQKIESESLINNLQHFESDSENILTKEFPESFKFQVYKEKIGGDFLWQYANDENVIICLGDVGNGLPGAIISMTVKDIINHIVKTTGIVSPNMILTLVDQGVEQKLNPLKQSEFPGIGLAVINFNKKTGDIDICSSNVCVWRSNKGEIIPLKINKLFIGNPNFKASFFESDSCNLSSGEIIFLSSDGFYNQIGGANRQRFSRAALEKLLISTVNQKGNEPNFILDKVLQEWKGSEPQTDDITIVGIRKA